MKIASLQLQTVEQPLNVAFDIAGGKSSSVKSVLVRMTDDQGLSGCGEAVPMPAYSGQTVQGVVEALEVYLFPALLAGDVHSIEQLHEIMGQAIKEQPMAKAAIDLAYHDLVARRLGVPVYELLGGRCRERVALSWAIGLGEPEQLVQEAQEMIGRGYRSIKFKIGIDPERDLEVVARARETVGEGISLRVDANEGYSYREAASVLPRMERYSLQLIEQPLPRWDIEGMQRLCSKLNTPLLADESLYSVHDALQLIKQHAADLFNIKLMKVGGLRPAMNVAAIARAANIGCMVGSMPELGLATMAGAHFALATSQVQYPCELIGPQMTDSDVVQQELYALHDDEICIPAPAGPGLGVDLHSRIAFPTAE
jgi:muconate cycloisomerase